MRKSIKLLICIALSAIILTAVFAICASAEDATPISTAEDFEKIIGGKEYYLTQDIDFAGKEYTDYIVANFFGKIDGKGHSIYNFKIVTSGTSDAGIIQRACRYIDENKAEKTGNLEIVDLNIGKENLPAVLTGTMTANSKSIGMLAGSMNSCPSLNLNNVNLYYDINIDGDVKVNIGGVVGYSRTFIFTNCKTYGKIQNGGGMNSVYTTYHNAGGYIGSGNADAQFIECENHAEIITYCSTKEACAAGFVAYSASSIYFDFCVNYGNVTVYDSADQKADGYAAGFIAHANKASGFLLEDCYNCGDVTASNYCSGFAANVNKGCMFENCKNYGLNNKDAIKYGAFYASTDDETGIEEVDCVDAPGQTPVIERTTDPADDDTDPSTPVESKTETASETTKETEKEPASESRSETQKTPEESKTEPNSNPTDDNKGCKSSVVGIIPAMIVTLLGSALIKKKIEG